MLFFFLNWSFKHNMLDALQGSLKLEGYELNMLNKC